MTTNEGNIFYTNTETKTSVWTVPEEIKGVLEEQEAKKKKDEAARVEAAAKAEAERILKEKEAEMQKLREELEREREASRKRKLQEEQEMQERLERERERIRREAEEEEAQQRASKRTKIDHARNGEDDDGDEEADGAEGRADDVEEEDGPEGLEDWQMEELAAKAELEAELENPAQAAPEVELSTEESMAIFKVRLGALQDYLALEKRVPSDSLPTFLAFLPYTDYAGGEGYQSDAALGHGAAQVHQRSQIQR